MANRKTILKTEDFHRAMLIIRGHGFYSLDSQGSYTLNAEREKGKFDYDPEEYKVDLADEKYYDPEKILIKKEAWRSLSDEAKEVINILLKAPSETLDALSTPTGLITKRSIQLGLQKLWKSKFIAKIVVEELTQWANRL